MPYLPERIVCLQPSATVILAGIGQLERVVACTKYCLEVCPEATRGRTIVSDSWAANSAQITAVKPDLVIAAVPYQEKAVSEILKSGVRFLGLAPRRLDDIYMDIATIGGVVGGGFEGERMIAHMKDRIESVRRRVGQTRRPRVFCEEWGKPIIASQPWVAELVEAAGGTFLGEPGRQRSADAVLAENPEVFIAAWCGAGDRVPLEKIVRERGWEGMRATLDFRVYCISDELLNTPAPTLLKGLDAIAAAIHPELFPASPGLRRIDADRGSRRQHLERK